MPFLELRHHTTTTIIKFFLAISHLLSFSIPFLFGPRVLYTITHNQTGILQNYVVPKGWYGIILKIARAKLS